MENYIEILDSLMKAKKEKKKKDPTIKEKEAFRSAWLSLAADAGFTGRAEQFLYEGFAFCGAEPFYAYLVQTKDPNATLTTLFSGKHYGNDSNVSFRLITHLLVLMINDNAPANVLAPIIKRLPGACINKDKKRLGTAEKTMEKYFLAELRPDVTLTPLADIGTKPVFIKDFVALVTSVIDGIEKSGTAKGLVTDNIARIRKWFADYDAETAGNTPDKKDPSSVAATGPEVIRDNNASDKEGNTSPKTPEPSLAEEPPADMVAHLIDLLGKASKVAAVVKSESAQQKTKIELLNQSLESERENLLRAKQQIAEQQNTIAELRKSLSAAESDIFVFKQESAKKDVVIAEKDAEISERIKMADVLSRDRSKQADETLQRLASKIKVEYRDFTDALDVPMSCDLGENLRLQLQSVFDILEKGGMRIK